MAADAELGLSHKLSAAHEKHPASGGLRPDEEGAMLPRSAPPAALNPSETPSLYPPPKHFCLLLCEFGQSRL